MRCAAAVSYLLVIACTLSGCVSLTPYAELPCYRFVALPDVGHLAMEESPRRLAAELRQFLVRPAAVCTG